MTHTAPHPDSAEHYAAGSILRDYGLSRGQTVEVELMSPGPGGGVRLLEGTITTATAAVLVITSAAGQVTNRLPWHAVANVRNPIPVHPAN